MLDLLLVGPVTGAFLALWFALGTWGGVLCPGPATTPAEGRPGGGAAVVPERRAREPAGGFVVDGVGPVGLGRRRQRVSLPWKVTVSPPLVSMRLRASVAQARKRRDA